MLINFEELVTLQKRVSELDEKVNLYQINLDSLTEQELELYIIKASKKTAIGGKATPILRKLLSEGVIKPEWLILDYGKGKNRNVNHLELLGFNVEGFDINFDKTLPSRHEFDFILCQYVLNVVLKESRKSILRDIKLVSHSKTLILLEVRNTGQIEKACKKATSEWLTLDSEGGYITSRGTFQYGFQKNELQSFIESMGFKINRILANNSEKTALLIQIK